MSKMKVEKKQNKLIKVFKLPRNYIAFKAHKKNGDLPGTYRNLKKLHPIYKKSASYYNQLSKLAYDQQLWEESLKYINDAIKLANKNAAVDFYKHKANTLIKLSKFEQAITYLESYLDANPSDSISNYILGECYLKIYLPDQAEYYYEQAIENPDLKYTTPSIAQIYYELGLMRMKDNKYTHADKTFSKAIKYDQDLNSHRFGIGVLHEYFKQWEYAVSAYKNELKKNDKDAELHFKLAALLDKLGNPEKALNHYKNALHLDNVLSKWHYSLANCYEQLEDYSSAAEWYKSGIIRQQKHSPGNYRRLAFVLNQIGKPAEALEAYSDAELFRRPSTVSKTNYDKDIKKNEVRYAISYEHYPVVENMIFYESLGGGRIMGNPYAIFEQVYSDSNFENYMHIWVVKSFTVIPDELKNKNNIIFVKRNSDAYFRYLASAKYLVCNSTFAEYVVRKPKQFYLQTSHGIFYKTVGRDNTGNPIGAAGGTRNLLQATHIIVPNEFMSEKQPKSYSIKDINSGQIAKIGYPRIDVTIDATDEFKQQISSKLKLNPRKKTVFYAPTWRGGSKSSKRFDSNKLISDLKMLAALDANVIFRGHTKTNSLLNDVTFPENIILPTPDIQTNEILSIADVLISDYSSVFFDFIPTERPIVHYLYDVDEYTRERGLNLTEDELPGTIAKTSNQLFEAVKHSLKHDEPSSHYLKAKERFCTYDDGNSSERVVRWFFYGDSTDIDLVYSNTKNKSYLYLGGTLSNKTKIPELVTELNELKQDDCTVSLMLVKSLTEDDEKLSKLKKLDPNINLLAHAGNIPATLEEKAAISYFNENGKFANNRMYNAYIQAFKREARRLFGDSTFDRIINYEENSKYWNGLFDNISHSTSNKT